MKQSTTAHEIFLKNYFQCEVIVLLLSHQKIFISHFLHAKGCFEDSERCTLGPFLQLVYRRTAGGWEAQQSTSQSICATDNGISVSFSISKEKPLGIHKRYNLKAIHGVRRKMN